MAVLVHHGSPTLAFSLSLPPAFFLTFASLVLFVLEEAANLSHRLILKA